MTESCERVVGSELVVGLKNESRVQMEGSNERICNIAIPTWWSVLDTWTCLGTTCASRLSFKGIQVAECKGA